MTYTAGQTITCPGFRTDRRAESRTTAARLAERRLAPRNHPCRQTYGRVVEGTVAFIKTLPTRWDDAVEAEGRPTLICRCPGCHGYMALTVEAAARAA